MNRAAEPAPAVAPAVPDSLERSVGLNTEAPELVVPGQVPAESYRPRDVLALQRFAGNAAVTGLIQPIQRDSPAPTTPLPPARLVKKKKKGPVGEPYQIDESLAEVVVDMPSLVHGVNSAAYKHVVGSRYAHGATEAQDEARITVTGATVFARDAVYDFGADGSLLSVDSNLSYPVDPAHPDDLPPPRLPLPDTSVVLVVNPASGLTLRVGRFDKGTQISLAALKGPMPPIETLASGGWQLLAYAPSQLASEDGGPQPGFVAKAKSKDKAGKDAGGSEPGPPPKAAEAQLDRVRAMLKDADGGGSGTGLAGTGPGGGGTDAAGTGTGTSGKGSGASTTTPGTGRGGRARPRDRAVPDKVVLYQGKRGTNVNVWKGGAAESIPYKEGESDASLLRQIEEAAARLLSGGKRLADGGADTGFLFGHGGGTPTEEEMAEATATSANAQAYPSHMAMQGGSGAEISPKGWATTVAGADHDFDMVLDWDAITFGQANQTFARLGFISYFWEVIDVSSMNLDATSKEGARTAAYESKKQNPDNARHVRKLSDWKGVSNTVKDAGEDLEADRPDFSLTDSPGAWTAKAGELAIEGISATWDIAKSVISAFIEKMTEPENRQTIHLKDPGEYVIRCLANPLPNKDKPEDERTIRATSVAAFPVRVLEIDTRAKEVSRSEDTEVERLSKALEKAQAALTQAPGDAGKQATVDLLSADLASKRTKAGQTTSQRLADDLDGLINESVALQHLMVFKGDTSTLHGAFLAAALQVKNGEGLHQPWEFELRLEDVNKSIKAKQEQLDQAKSWSGKELAKGADEVRPRVTFVSEENGAVVRMSMILGQAPGSTDENPKWALLDVTSPKTQRKYHGESDTPGYKGHSEAIEKAFNEFAEKAEYGRGTIATGLPSMNATRGTPSVPDTLPMRPGPFDRWRNRLKNIVEMASLVAPFMEGGVLAEVAAAGGAADSAYKLYDRAVANKLHADWETLTDVIGALGPALKGAKALSELDTLVETKTGYVLRLTAEGGELASTYLMPASIVHDLDQVIRDTAMDPSQKQAQVAMILGRGLRDKVIHIAGEQLRYSREGAWEADEPSPVHGSPPGSEAAPKPGSEKATEEPLTPAARPVGHEGEPASPELVGPKPGEEPDAEAGHGGGIGVGHGGGGGAGGGAGGGEGAPVPATIPAETVASLQEMSAHYWISIDVRPPSRYVARWLGLKAKPKPVEIKAKTINDADVLLGAPPKAAGLVAYFRPELPERPPSMGEREWEQVVARYADRLEEYHDLAEDMSARVADGTIQIKSGIVLLREPRGKEGAPAYRPVTGDVDLYQIHWKDGRPMTKLEADFFAGELRKHGIAVEHGAHLRWEPKTDKERAIYNKIVAGHDPGAEKLIRFEPSEVPKPVDNQTPIEPRTGPRWNVDVVGEPGQAGPGGGSGGPGRPPAGGPDELVGSGAPTAATGTPVRGQGSDLEPGRAPSIPSGAVFEPQPEGRYVDTGDKPVQGLTEGEIVVDPKTNRRYLFKPSNQEVEVPRARERGILAGDYAPRAVASELVAKALDIVTPHVELVVIGGKKGSLTEWFDQISLQELATKQEPVFQALRELPAFRQARETIETFDYLVNNVDRLNNKGNYLVEFNTKGEFARLIPIDHDLTFTSTRARAQITEFASGMPRSFSPEMVTHLKKLWSNREQFAESIRPLVGDEAVEGFLLRLVELVEAAEAQAAVTPEPTTPAPAGGRP